MICGTKMNCHLEIKTTAPDFSVMLDEGLYHHLRGNFSRCDVKWICVYFDAYKYWKCSGRRAFAQKLFAEFGSGGTGGDFWRRCRGATSARGVASARQ